jgi:hypothetical protein
MRSGNCSARLGRRASISFGGSEGSGRRYGSEGPVGNLISKIDQVRDLRDQLQVANAYADRYMELVRVDNPGKRDFLSQSTCRLPEKIGISREEYPTEHTSPVEQVGIRKRCCPILASRQHVYPTCP